MSKTKPKVVKKGKKRMDIDAFIEDELKNLDPSGSSNKVKLSKSSIKGIKKNPALIKPAFATKKIKKRVSVQEEPILMNESEHQERPVSKYKSRPFKPTKITTKSGVQPIMVPAHETAERMRPVGPSKLLEVKTRAKNRLFDEPATKVKQHASDDSYDEDFEKYDEDFESESEAKTKKKIIKFNNQSKPNLTATNTNSMVASNGFNNKNVNSPVAKAEGGFAQNRGIVMNKRKTDNALSNKQYERIENLRPLIEIEYEEYHNQLNLKPQNAQDMYFNKLQTHKIHNEMVQSNDDNIDRDVQTDAIEETDVACQAPEDLFVVDKTVITNTVQDLNGFINRITPTMEVVLDENIQLLDLLNPAAQNKNPVEKKAEVTCPNDLLIVLKSKIAYIS
jgi:hypothetical protein